MVVDSGQRALAETGYAERQRELAAGMPGRVRHVETESRRVRDAVAALERGDTRKLGDILRESHESLRDDYEVSTPELDGLVERAYDAGATAARLTGGGFGGSIVVLAECDRAAALAQELGGRIVRASDGAGELTPRRTGSRPDRA
jgi:galactokinase